MARTQSRRIGLSLLLVAVASTARGDELTPEQALAHEIHAELVGIDTTAEHGSTTEAAEAVARRLQEAGFTPEELFLAGPSPRKGNLVARLHGSGSEKPLLLLAHLDVVEAKREDWSVEPFQLLERDGYYYGRGSLDDKAMAAIFSAKLIRLKREGKAPRRDVILALTADEEGGPENGVEWLLENQRGLVDAGIVLNEGGGGRMRKGKYLANSLQASEKTYMNFALEVRDRGGHSSLPRKENAIYALAAGLERLAAFSFPIELNEITRVYLERSAAMESDATAAAMRALAADPADAAAAATLAETPLYNAILRTTCVATRVEAGHANNALPQSARAVVNCRILPGQSAEKVRETLVQVLQDERINVTATEPEIASPLVPLDPTVIAAVEKVTAELFPGVPVVPSMGAGATDSKYFRRAGIPAYGVSGIFADVDDVRAHGRDERIGVKQFYEGQAFLDRLVDALALP
jgi:acetylornithine deacetylase/succinyl-diaminopimelate desuccinylase-like protein